MTGLLGGLDGLSRLPPGFRSLRRGPCPKIGRNTEPAQPAYDRSTDPSKRNGYCIEGINLFTSGL